MVRVRHAEALAGLDQRLAEIETRPESRPVDDDARRAAERLAGELDRLRDALRLELVEIDTQLQRLSSVLEEVAGELAGPDPTGPLPEEDEPRYVVKAGDPDPGVRFSALVRLGRRRSDRSVQASVSRLGDADDSVVWIALTNLGAFRERAAAPEIAALLSHDAALVRQKAHHTLVRLGAPSDSGFDALDPAEVRETAAARLRAWSEE